MTRAVLLFAASVLFVWMFLAADPLERAGAFAEAALWRHGMAGNSPLYMPGFFAVAVAAWSWAHAKRLSRLWVEGSAAIVAACAVAAALVPSPSLRTAALAAYTLTTWTIFVVCCRQALSRRLARSLWPVAPMTLGLIAIRTWTLDDVRSIWIERLLQGDPAAVASTVGILLLVTWMLLSELTSSTRGGAAPAPTGHDALRKLAPRLPSGQSQ